MPALLRAYGICGAHCLASLSMPRISLAWKESLHAPSVFRTAPWRNYQRNSFSEELPEAGVWEPFAIDRKLLATGIVVPRRPR